MTQSRDEYELSDLNEAITAWRGRMRRLERTDPGSSEAVEARAHLRYLERQRELIVMRTVADSERRRVR